MGGNCRPSHWSYFPGVVGKVKVHAYILGIQLKRAHYHPCIIPYYTILHYIHNIIVILHNISHSVKSITLLHITVPHSHITLHWLSNRYYIRNVRFAVCQLNCQIDQVLR